MSSLPGPVRPRADIITTLPGSVLFRAAVDVYLRHQPGPMGSCSCGQLGCRSRYNATQVIEAAGVEPLSVTAADAAPRPWHERPVPSAAPAWGAGAAQCPAFPTGVASAPGAARPALVGGQAGGERRPPADGPW
ncbi:hypothetical protein [Micromonospora cathayae]|uniref:Post-SET domain-containing protein n=1 Tax=Micromonospora cathayae TaxID=3028804 RepID=A0ABY7ZM68_9ACTN|nr:hypothetical protein [Micromonospora sp. HUAS 3]WDZ84000.1 hypothetical protein PVK37_26590 [Micromonospora sp. HUAS 3]